MITRIVALAGIALAAQVHARVWTTSENKTFDADYVSATGTHVSVRVRDGRVVPVELTRLSQADRDFVAQQPPAKPAPAGTPPPPSAATTTTPPPPKPFGTATQPAARRSPYAEFLANDWKQFEGKGGLQCMLFGAPVADATKKLPLVIYLHGKGNKVLTKAHLGLAEAVAKPENFSARPCFILAPQCPDENGWGGATGANFMKTLKDMMRHLPIDEDRVYLTGYSMGGYGTFAFLNDEPRMFAAGIPIAGGANVAIARNLKKTPLWIFHGENDDVVKPDDSRAIAKALEKMKAPAKYTEFPGEGHGIGGKIFNDPAVHAWLFAQKRK
jgi:predicted peptidase